MPRLVHRPPKYSLHKSTNQAVVHHQGKKVFLGRMVKKLKPTEIAYEIGLEACCYF